MRFFYSLFTFLLMGHVFAGLPAEQEIDHVSFEFPFPRYLQELEITFASAEAASDAIIRVAPLYDNYERAVSCRWDDNHFNNLEVQKRLNERGVKATWYLNSNDIFYLKDLDQDYRPVAQKLLEGGHSIGSHAVSHPYITYTSRNRMFFEVMAVKIEWEARTNSLINSHAFSFIDYRNDAEGDSVQADVIRSLERAGIYHAPVFIGFHQQLSSDMILSIIMPPENASFDDFKRAVEWAVGSDELKETFPLISHSMHGWYDTPAVQYGFDELEKRLDFLNSYENFWQCNQNEYAAYRYQFKYTDLRQKESVDETRRFILERPEPRWLNDSTPLTVIIESEGAASIVRDVKLDGNVIEPSLRSDDNTYFYNLSHTSSRPLPVRIDHRANDLNAPLVDQLNSTPAHNGIKVSTAWSDYSLRSILQNESGHPLNEVTLTWRLPLPWQEGVVVSELNDLEPGREVREVLVPNLARLDPKFLAGDFYFVAQYDFIQEGQPRRIYSTVTVSRPVSSLFPNGNVQIFGPAMPENFDLNNFIKHINEGGEVLLFSLNDGAKFQIRDPDSDCKFSPKILDPEVVPTNCDWYDLQNRVYLFETIIESDSTQPAQLICLQEDIPALWANGVKVKDFNIELREGKNKLLILHHFAQFAPGTRQSGSWLRLANPDTGERLENIRWIHPQESTHE
jgi:peptidoglycan/xylan/chitin deacetylase (PgdA/CDA1 family)